METVACGKCGQRFAIHHDAASQDADLARKQASWVTEQLVWDHIQERKHHGAIKLPQL
jgi:transcription elongation factor Elf1